MNHSKFFIVLIPPLLIILLFLWETLYFNDVFQKVVLTPSTPYDLVLMYGGSGRPERAIQLAVQGKAPILVSGDKVQIFDSCKDLPLSFPYWVDTRAKTTDQNARFSASIITERGYKHIALLTDWFHAPRAIFLTQFYLRGTGITVVPCVNDPVPPHWWTYYHAKNELFKFWGSLGRIGLHLWGIDNWPPHEWMPGQSLYPAAASRKE